jgi:hypothetical protein
VVRLVLVLGVRVRRSKLEVRVVVKWDDDACGWTIKVTPCSFYDYCYNCLLLLSLVVLKDRCALH